LSKTNNELLIINGLKDENTKKFDGEIVEK